ncbi:type IV secretory system conjugative DNA transfer family protein [Nocardia bovistercoris]|uniref:Uncharacterized protein n=1 Tax=Nocardia bovistercoris TaxID=2785916 RepID=A0A931I5Q6_9NOCA|nr:hypothetical protein [Nocardia bovistercoris]MBH0775059.1 hypothetical protein [Nocardia bovistercoris]
MSNDPNCTPILTPTDCGPIDTAPHADPSTAGAVDPTISPITPQAPPVEGVQGWDLPTLDVSAVGHVAATGTVCGVVIVALLILIVAVAVAWLPPARLRNFAIASLLLPATSALAGGSWSVPASLLWSGAERVTTGDLAGLRAMLILGAPVAALMATYYWAQFLHKTHTVGLKSLERTERVKDTIHTRRFAAAARAARVGAPSITGHGIVLGPLAKTTTAKTAGLWQELTARHENWLVVPHKQARRHLALVSTTGGGKTELIKRFFAGMLEYEWTAWQQWKTTPGVRGKYPRPLMVVISCKGGADDKALGLEISDLSRGLGIEADRIATVGPGGDRLDQFRALSARDMRGVVGEMLNAGQASTSEGQHFDEMRRRIVSLVVGAPGGPPRSSQEFLARLNEDTLLDLWGHAPDVKRMIDALQGEKVPQLDDALIKAMNLFDLLQDQNGAMVFDGGKDLDALDVLYVTVPGLDKDAARAQVAAILRMVMQKAGRTAKHLRRSVTVVIDEASATTTATGALNLVDVCERGRSQGVALAFAAQSQEGLATDKWSLNRLLKACAGGLILGYNENAGDLCEHLGTVRSMLPSRHLIKGQRTGDEGQVSVGDKWLVDPDRLRELATGQFVYARARRADWGQVVQVDRSSVRPMPGTPAHTAHKTATTTPGVGAPRTAGNAA